MERERAARVEKLSGLSDAQKRAFDGLLARAKPGDQKLTLDKAGHALEKLSEERRELTLKRIESALKHDVDGDLLLAITAEALHNQWVADRAALTGNRELGESLVRDAESLAPGARWGILRDVTDTLNEFIEKIAIAEKEGNVKEAADYQNAAKVYLTAVDLGISKDKLVPLNYRRNPRRFKENPEGRTDAHGEHNAEA